MSLISWLRSKIFGNRSVEKPAPARQPSANNDQVTPPQLNDFMARWERERTGEFRMDGSGTLYLADNHVKAKYSDKVLFMV